jgi:hypothetical protein
MAVLTQEILSNDFSSRKGDYPMTARSSISLPLMGAVFSLAFTAAAVAQPTPPAVLNPADPSLRLWLDAKDLVTAGLVDGAPINSWVDKSSYGTIMAPRTTTDINGPYIGDPVEERPHLRYVDINGNNVPTVRFDRDGPPSNLGDPNVDGSGSTDRLYQTNNLAPGFDPLNIGDGTSLTTFVVFRPEITTTLNEQGGPVLGAEVVYAKRGTSSAVYELGIWNFPGSTLGDFNYVTYDGPTSYFSATAPMDKVWHVTSQVITDVPGTSADQIQMFDAQGMDPNQTLTSMGVKLGDGTPVTNIQNRNASTPEPFGIGGHSQACCGEGETFAGNIAELIIFAKTLTPTEYNSVATYLSQKYFTQAAAGPAGDYNGDGHVDGGDLTVFKSEFGVTPVPAAPNADGDGNGVVDGNDFLIWQKALGASGGGTAAVPEPATVTLLLGSLLLGSRMRQRRRA